MQSLLLHKQEEEKEDRIAMQEKGARLNGLFHPQALLSKEVLCLSLSILIYSNWKRDDSDSAEKWLLQKL